MSLVVVAVYLAQAGQETVVADALTPLQTASLREPGCLDYKVHRDPQDPRRFLLYERYADQEALDAHRASEHFQQYVQNRAIPALEAREVSVWQPIEDHPGG